MNDVNVIAFPQPETSLSKADDFRDWLGWAECELVILGYDFSACDFDWRTAHAKGLRPEEAAAQAAQVIEAD
ncbi:MAG: hypothetical protein ACFCUT_19395 [Kiloniellaceae bacterium]